MKVTDEMVDQAVDAWGLDRYDYSEEAWAEHRTDVRLTLEAALKDVHTVDDFNEQVAFASDALDKLETVAKAWRQYQGDDISREEFEGTIAEAVEEL